MWKKAWDKREEGKDIFFEGKKVLLKKVGGSWLQGEEKYVPQAQKKLHMQN